MSPSANAGIAELIRRADHWRRSPASANGALGHKEWMHFCVLSPDVHALINFSLLDDRQRAEVPSLVLLMKPKDGGWLGCVDRPGFAAASAGSVGVSIGASRIEFLDGEFRVEAESADRELRAALRLRPIIRPALTTSVPLGPGASMKWAVVPRLIAEGELRLAGRRIALHDAPAYHDHDWGCFQWGGNFAWEWAIVLGEHAGEPCTVVLQRITDRGRHRVLSQGVLIWRGGVHARTMHGSSVEFRSVGRRSSAGALRLPPVMSLAAPGSAADLPRRLEVVGARGKDRIEVTLDIGEPVQIGIPDDRGLGTTIVSETSARARVSGCLAGEPLVFEAPAIAEFNRAAA